MKKQMSREALFVTAFFLGALTVSVFVIIGIIVLKPEFMINSDKTEQMVVAADENIVTQNPTPSLKDQKKENIQITDELQFEFNIYLSNFSEIGFSSFKNSPSKSDQIDFAVRHIYLNRKQLLSIADVTINKTKCDNCIKFSSISEIVKQYFDINLNTDDLNNYPFYRDGYIYFDSSTIQAGGFAIVDKIESDGNDKYTVSFRLYDGSNNSRSNYELSPSEASAAGIKPLGCTGKAIISTQELNNHSSFKLEYYSVSSDK